MAFLASPVYLGSVSMISSSHFEGSVCLVRRVTFRRDGGNNIRRYTSGKRWRYLGICKFSVTTNNITEQGISISSGAKDDDANAFLKAAPKPVLKSGTKEQLNLNMPWDGVKLTEDSDDERTSNSEEERSKVIESLGEALEKIEENKKQDVSLNRPSANQNAGISNGTPVNSVTDFNRKSITRKSVWRKGNPVTAPKVFQEPVEQGPRLDGRGEGGRGEGVSRPVMTPTLPQLPEKAQPLLQAKPSVAPPVPPPVPIKRPVILKDINAGAKPAVSDETSSPAAPKERKPILIDKFARAQPVVDPLIAQAVLAPMKPGKSSAPGKFKEFRKKGGSPVGPRRRMVANDDNADEDESDVSIPGAATARKGRKWSKASRKASRRQAARDAAPVKVDIMEVSEDGMLIQELAHNLAVSEGEILGSLFVKGINLDGVQKLSKDMVKMICEEYEVEVVEAAAVRVEDMAKKKEMFDEDDLDKLEDRPPVLTIMGHVDHGKTTLLDYIRKSKVAAFEAGGITQGIGAYKVQVPVDGKPQTSVFLDTPGHEAFGAMRARGARVTDIAVIVVAADDGIRPQTNEAIAHAKAAGVPVIVAINKIDKDGANPDRVMQDLSSIGLMPEEWGGDVPMVKISALKGENVDDLLETIMLVAELQELKANPHRNAKGTVIDATLEKSRGPVATFIVQNGTLKRGDMLACGETYGKVRALFDDQGKRIDKAGPSMPVQVIGLHSVPLAGDEFEVVGSLDIAHQKAEARAEYLRNERLTAKAGDGMVTLSSLASAVNAGKLTGLDLHQLNIVLKVDCQGSVEAIRQALQVLPQDNVTLKFLLQATGDVTSSDIDLATASKAIIFGFNVKTPGSIKSYADTNGVEIRLYRVIYDIIDDVRKAMEGLLEPVEEQVPIGSAEVRAVFSSGSGRVAGCMVTEGKVVKASGIRVLRKGRKEVHVGVLSSLRRVKELVKEVSAGLECGIGADDFDDWQEGDTVEAFISVQKRRTLEEASASVAAALEQRHIRKT